MVYKKKKISKNPETYRGRIVGWSNRGKQFTESQFKRSWIKRNSTVKTYPIYKKEFKKNKRSIIRAET